MKVLQICGAQHAGGAEAHFLRFCIELNRFEGIEVIALVRKGSWLEEQLGRSDIKTYPLGFRSSFDLITRYRIKKISYLEKADIIQCWMNRAASLTPKTGHGAKIGRLGGYYALKYYKSMDWLVGATEDLCQHIKEAGWNPAHLSCIPNFVNLPAAKDPMESEQLRKTMGLTGKTVIITPARLHSVKGLDTAIQAIKLLPEHYVYLIVGTGPEESHLKQLTETLGVQHRVIFTGWQNNISDFCYGSDIFLVPSRHEPFGSVLLEAWSHQLPLITSDSQGALAITEHNRTCLMYDKHSATALKEAVMTLAADDALMQALITQGYQELLARYTAKPVLNQYIDTYAKASHAEQTGRGE
ncbi:glycosyltransferase [Nitrincola sp.]|uniref:glycosyltransferase n=1 Tax=Nitrincola sp. TaxID=1926584 RepID=UPI003A959C63